MRQVFPIALAVIMLLTLSGCSWMGFGEEEGDVVRVQCSACGYEFNALVPEQDKQD